MYCTILYRHFNVVPIVVLNVSPCVNAPLTVIFSISQTSSTPPENKCSTDMKAPASYWYSSQIAECLRAVWFDVLLRR